MWGHTVVSSNGTQASRAGHTLILTTLVIFVTTGTSLNQACGYNQICSCQIQNGSESVIFTGIQTHCSAVVGLGLETQITLLVCIHLMQHCSNSSAQAFQS